ncbi:MAG: hypothetical protein ACREPY_01355 [Rhodanobacteraceae bacterium]
MSLPLLLVIFAAIGYLIWRHYVNAKALLQDWATASHFKILKASRNLVPPLSWLFTTSKYQVVYRVSIYDESSHRIREAWVRLGRGMWGVMDGDAIDVKWKDEPA